MCGHIVAPSALIKGRNNVRDENAKSPCIMLRNLKKVERFLELCVNCFLLHLQMVLPFFLTLFGHTMACVF